MERAAVSRKPNIGIRELKENLSAVVDSAWEHPVSVHRYGSPWVWIVSHEVWTRNTRRIDFNPAGHPLAAVRQHLDMAMRERQPRLHAAALRAMLRIEAQPLLRALAVQLLYGLETEAALHEQISCNLLFRWFVGLSLDQQIWTPQEFGYSLERVLASAELVAILEELLLGAPVAPIAQATGIPLNQALLREWRARSVRAVEMGLAGFSSRNRLRERPQCRPLPDPCKEIAVSAIVTVGMLELDRKLSKVLDSARRVPVSVSRYGSPWVWVVSHEAWMGQVQLTRFVPPRHPLVGLREHVDDVLRGHAAMLEAVAQLALRTDAAVLCRAFILQLLYPVGSRRYFLEQIAYNLLFRWFAGLDAGLGADEADLDRELDLIGRRPEIVQVLHQALDDGLLTPPSWAVRKRAARSPAGTGQRPLARGVAGYAANAGLAGAR